MQNSFLFYFSSLEFIDMQQQHDNVLESVLTPPPENNEQKFNQNQFWMTANGEKPSIYADPCEFIPFLFEPETEKPNEHEQIMLKNDENKIKDGCRGMEENEVEIIEAKLSFEDLTTCKEIQNHRELLDVDIKNKPDFDEKIDEEFLTLCAKNYCESENDAKQNRKGNTKEMIRIDIKSKPIRKHSTVPLKYTKKIEKPVLKPVKFDVPVILYQVKDSIKNVNFINQSVKVNGFTKSGLCSIM